MKQIRKSVFETNSSSTHSISICSKKDFDRWSDGELYLNDNSYSSSKSEYIKNKFVTKDQAIDIIVKSLYNNNETVEELNSLEQSEFEELLRQNELYSYNIFMNDEYLEYFEESYKTESGDEIVAFGKYGQDY